MIGRTNSGTGGGISTKNALLVVYAPIGSIVTATNGTTTKTSNTGIALSDRPTVEIHLLSVPQLGTWTVTATRDTETNSTTISITAVERYELYIGYHVPLQTYQEVEYLESTGATSSSAKQYIDTAHATTQPIRIKSKFAYIGGNIYFAKQTNVSGATLGFNCESDGFAAQIAGTHGGQTVIHTGYQPVVGQVYDLDFNARVSNPYISLDGNIILEYASGDVSYRNSSLYIFAGHGMNGAEYYGNYRLYTWQLYDANGNLIRDYYPCYRLSDSVAGLYDKANGVFYQNNGTGTFVLGADIS